jgi:HD domain
MRNKFKLEDGLYGHVESTFDKEKGSYTNHILRVRTVNGIVDLKYWNLSNRDSFPVAGDFVQLKVLDLAKAAEELDEYRDISLDSTSKYKPFYCRVVLLNEEDVPADVRGKIRKDRSAQRDAAKKMLVDASYWRDRKVHEFLLSFVKEHSEKFATVPAAVGHHHAYRGGLFVHTCEVFCNCVGIVNSPMNEFYGEQIDSDALYLAAWLHDMGKIKIYSMEGDQPKIDSEMENRIGHTTLSDRLFLGSVTGLNEQFVDLVSHCILSHHERPEWGAVVVPSTVEAHILCRADFISSRMPD